MSDLPSPWREFVREVDSSLTVDVELHCLGGFVLTALYALPRPTADIDFISAVPQQHLEMLLSMAGHGTPMARKHGVYLEFVGLGDYPDDYDERLIDLASDLLRLRLRALDPHDVALAKLTRNSPKDRFDVGHLAKSGVLDATRLRQIYEKSMRGYLVNLDRHDLTLDLWIEEYFS